MTGSQNLENAIDYMVHKLKKAGLENVHIESARVPHWERGYENCEMLSPRKHKIKIAGLGTTVGTPCSGITADLIAVESFDEFSKLSVRKVRGKIVLFVPEWKGYEETSKYHTNAASVASKKGAVAALVRSVTPFSIGSLHAGVQNYEENVRKIPVAAVTVEDAYMLLRMYRRGETITVKLEMEDFNLGNSSSRNTIAELTGQSSQPVVVVSGHLDSWDFGVGAMDDGGGAFISWKALQLLKTMGLAARRTIRAILWTGEEQGNYGATAYEAQHKADEQNEFSFFIVSDLGTFDPRGFEFSGNPESECIFKEILKLMAPLNATEFKTPIFAGMDTERWTSRGFPGASLLTKDDKYFYFHHSDGDSMLVENPVSLDKNAAVYAALAFVIADLSFEFPRNITT